MRITQLLYDTPQAAPRKEAKKKPKERPSSSSQGERRATLQLQLSQPTEEPSKQRSIRGFLQVRPSQPAGAGAGEAQQGSLPATSSTPPREEQARGYGTKPSTSGEARAAIHGVCMLASRQLPYKHAMLTFTRTACALGTPISLLRLFSADTLQFTS